MPKLPSLPIKLKKPNPQKVAEGILYSILGAVMAMVAVIILFAANPSLTGMVSDVLKKSNEDAIVRKEIMLAESANKAQEQQADVDEEISEEAEGEAIEETLVQDAANAAEPEGDGAVESTVENAGN